MEGEPPVVRTEMVGEIAVVTMDDGKANALSIDRIDQLTTALETAAVHAGAIVLAGRPGMFCAGLDLRTMEGASSKERDELRFAGIDLFRWMLGLRSPLVAACTGHAIAGGAMILLVSDVRIGAPGAYRVGLSEVAVGASMSPFGIAMAQLRLGSAAYPSTVLARIGDPSEALRTGFLDAVTDEPVGAAIEAAKLAAETLDPAAFATTKSTFYRRPVAL